MTCSAVAMVNILGERWANGEPLFELAGGDSSTHLHLYGKKDARAGRKMGHLTVTGDHADAVVHNAVTLRQALTR
jgi:5-(carboxyamino)imidazole ribonucleotide synthase